MMTLVQQKKLPTQDEVIPHDDRNQAHDSFIEAVEEIPQELALLPHAANYQTKAHGEDHQPEGVDPVHLTRHWDHFHPGGLHDLLGAIGGVEEGVIHCHCHMDCSLVIFGFELQNDRIRGSWFYQWLLIELKLIYVTPQNQEITL